MTPVTAAQDLTIAPRPQEMTGSGSGPSLATAPTERQVDGLPPQGFEIEITADDINVRHGDEAGLRYARGFLNQVRAQAAGVWPQLSVRDWPDYPVRGYMLDISRGRVPTRETLERIVEILELVRINHLQLYTEHTFAYADHEVVWRDASPLTADDVRWLDKRCQEAGIELVANQNCFGHMEHWLEHEPYRHRAEKPDGFQLFGRESCATTLAPTQENADFALDLLDELLLNYTSRQVNIGCDETWELGQGTSADDIRERGKGRVYLDHVRRLLCPLIERGYRPQFWGDIIARYPELVDDLPAGATAVAWIYQAPRTPDDRTASRFREVGLDPDIEFGGFAARSAPFIDAQYPFWVAPGTSTWQTLIGRIDNAVDNLIDAAGVGKASGAQGYLITDWGDRGHLQPPSVSFPPLVFGAAVGWALGANRDLAIGPVLDRFVFDDATGSLSSALDILGRLWDRTGQTAFNCSPLQAALADWRAFVVGDPDPSRVREVIAAIDSAINAISAADPGASDGGITKRELIAASRLARHGAYRQLRQVGVDEISDADLAADLDEAIGLQRQAWLKRSQPGGMNVGLDPLEATLATYASR